jgi:nitrogen fixation NifU-like protein
MLDELRDLYQEVILDHGKQPRNFRRLDHASREAAGKNPLCGDQLVVYVELGDDDRITDVSFLGKGCAISMASASMMTEIVKGKTIEEAKALFNSFHRMCTDEDYETPELSGDDNIDRLQVLSGVRQFPVRVKCATLAWHTLDAALDGVDEISTE